MYCELIRKNIVNYSHAFENDNKKDISQKEYIKKTSSHAFGYWQSSNLQPIYIHMKPDLCVRALHMFRFIVLGSFSVCSQSCKFYSVGVPGNV